MKSIIRNKTRLLLAFTLLTFGVTAQISTDSLKAHYSFNGDFTDLSGNGNHISNGLGTFSTNRFGASNSAIKLNGVDDSLVLPIQSFSPITGDFTISFWYKTRSPEVQNLLSCKDAPDDTVQNFEIQINSNNQYNLQNSEQLWYQTFVYWNGTGMNDNAIAEGGPGEFTKGEWCHFVISRSNDTLRIFRNRLEYYLSVETHFAGQLGDLSDLIIGASPYPFEGELDDLRFYTRSLSSDEVYSLYMENKPFEFISPKPTDAYIQGSNVFANWNYNSDLVSDSIQVDIRINNGPWTPAVHSNHDYENYSFLDMNLPPGSTVELRVADFSNPALMATSGPIEVSPYTFIEVSDSLPFTSRDGAGLLNFKGKMWLLGGWDPPYHPPNNTHSEVWNSTDGINWTQLPDAPWPARHCSAWLVHDSAMWVIGGDPQSGCLTDVWKSEDGITWTQTVDTIPFFEKRNNPNYGVVNGKLLIYGGEKCGGESMNDVWESEDGILWNQLPDAPWKGRGMQINWCTDDQDNLWMFGGSNESDRRSYNDVWKTSDGINWTEVLAAAPWNAKHWHTVAYFDEKLWVMAGMNTGYEANDVWYSSDGINWRQLKTTLGIWPAATRHAQSTTVYNDALWYMCGISTNNAWKIANTLEAGLSEKEQSKNVLVYPNPASNQLYIQVSDESLGEAFYIENQFGAVVQTGILVNEKTLVDTRNFAKGFYFLRVLGNQSVMKIIVQ